MEANKRWIERGSHLHRACRHLASLTGRNNPAKALGIYGEAALLKCFEITFELAWRTLQNYLQYEGCKKQETAQQVIQLALENGIIARQEIWRDMQNDCSLENYLYNPDEMQNIAKRINNNYVFELNALDHELRQRAKNV